MDSTGGSMVINWEKEHTERFKKIGPRVCEVCGEYADVRVRQRGMGTAYAKQTSGNAVWHYDDGIMYVHFVDTDEVGEKESDGEEIGVKRKEGKVKKVIKPIGGN